MALWVQITSRGGFSSIARDSVNTLEANFTTAKLNLPLLLRIFSVFDVSFKVIEIRIRRNKNTDTEKLRLSGSLRMTIPNRRSVCGRLRPIAVGAGTKKIYRGHALFASTYSIASTFIYSPPPPPAILETDVKYGNR